MLRFRKYCHVPMHNSNKTYMYIWPCCRLTLRNPISRWHGVPIAYIEIKGRKIIIHYITIRQLQDQIRTTWSDNISYISFTKSYIGQFWKTGQFRLQFWNEAAQAHPTRPSDRPLANVFWWSKWKFQRSEIQNSEKRRWMTLILFNSIYRVDNI